MDLKQEIKRLKEENEDLSIQSIDFLQSTLYFAGVKKSLLQKAVDEYLDTMDSIFDDEDEEAGLEDIIKIINHIKDTKKELFV